MDAVEQRKRISNLNKVAAYLSKLETTIITKSFTASRQQKLTTLETSLSKLQALMKDPNKPRGCAKSLLIASNQLKSYISPFENGSSVDVSTLSFEQPIKQISELSASLETSLSKQDILADENESRFDKYWERAQGEIKKVINDSKEQSKNLNSIKDKDFVVARVPLIPVADRPISVDKLEHSGMKVKDFAGYVVIYNQIVLGINNSAKQGSKDKLVNVKEELISKLEAVMNKELFEVATEGVPYKGAVWYWLAPAYEVNAIMKAAGGHVKIKHWGFSF